ncbi:hypothetical protein HDU85_005924 [Gaertneriomyces sp. JEL0708]|nr:hypothetical protein HDU85_005924 [Gaertneriomyces sp. JEL0708]
MPTLTYHLSNVQKAFSDKNIGFYCNGTRVCIRDLGYLDGKPNSDTHKPNPNTIMFNIDIGTRNAVYTYRSLECIYNQHSIKDQPDIEDTGEFDVSVMLRETYNEESGYIVQLIITDTPSLFITQMMLDQCINLIGWLRFIKDVGDTEHEVVEVTYPAYPLKSLTEDMTLPRAYIVYPLYDIDNRKISITDTGVVLHSDLFSALSDYCSRDEPMYVGDPIPHIELMSPDTEYMIDDGDLVYDVGLCRKCVLSMMGVVRAKLDPRMDLSMARDVISECLGDATYNYFEGTKHGFITVFDHEASSRGEYLYSVGEYKHPIIKSRYRIYPNREYWPPCVYNIGAIVSSSTKINYTNLKVIRYSRLLFGHEVESTFDLPLGPVLIYMIGKGHNFVLRDMRDRDRSVSVSDGKELSNDLASKIKGYADIVFSTLGAGYPDEVYVNSMEVMFRKHNIKYKKDVLVPIKFHREIVYMGKVTFHVENEIYIDIKAMKTNATSVYNKLRLKKYADQAGVKQGMLIDFGQDTLKYNGVVFYDINS